MPKFSRELNVLGLLSIGVLIVFFVNANPDGLYFLNDDFIHIPLASSGHFSNGSLLRPVSDMSLWVDSFIWGKNSYGFHLTNAAIHLANTFLLFCFYYRTVKSQNKGLELERSVFLALLFLVYAFHSESVFWVIGRGGSLAAFFILLALNCYSYSTSTRSMLVALAAFIAGLFTYESVWILPFVFLIIQGAEYFFKGKKPLWRWSIVFLATFIVYIVLRLNFQVGFLGDYELGALREGRFGRLLYNLSATIGRLFLPPMKDTGLFLVCYLGLFLVFLFLLLSKRRKRLWYAEIVIPLFCVVISCIPSISLGIDIHDTEGERFLYVPSIFGCWLIAELVFVLFVKFKYRIQIIACILLFHCFFFIQSSDAYRYASFVTKQSIDCLQMAQSSEVLRASELPSQYRGALIFRKGFESAVQWMVPGKYQHIIVVSAMEIEQPVVFRCDVEQQVFAEDVRRNKYVDVVWEEGVIRVK